MLGHASLALWGGGPATVGGGAAVAYVVTGGARPEELEGMDGR